jgi:hypothetical protein
MRVADIRFHAHIVRDRSGLAHVLETHTLLPTRWHTLNAALQISVAVLNKEARMGKGLVSATIRDSLRASWVPRCDPVLMISKTELASELIASA